MKNFVGKLILNYRVVKSICFDEQRDLVVDLIKQSASVLCALGNYDKKMFLQHFICV
jgi:hypothetical protein